MVPALSASWIWRAMPRNGLPIGTTGATIPRCPREIPAAWRPRGTIVSGAVRGMTLSATLPRCRTRVAALRAILRTLVGMIRVSGFAVRVLYHHKR